MEIHVYKMLITYILQKIIKIFRIIHVWDIGIDKYGILLMKKMNDIPGFDWEDFIKNKYFLMKNL